jgi:hypothetical protein
MELLQLIFFGFSYSIMSTANFLNTILVYLFLKQTYKNNIKDTNNLDPSIILINLINIILHVLFYQIKLLEGILKKNHFSNQVINIYNNVNSKYIFLKNKILYYMIFIPTKYLTNKAITHINNEGKYNIQLKSNQDVNKFLDGLLDKSK